ncbi:MAG: hypothetical protein AAF488_08130 [Planctomycetota bacterium]
MNLMRAFLVASLALALFGCRSVDTPSATASPPAVVYYTPG